MLKFILIYSHVAYNSITIQKNQSMCVGEIPPLPTHFKSRTPVRACAGLDYYEGKRYRQYIFLQFYFLECETFRVGPLAGFILWIKKSGCSFPLSVLNTSHLKEEKKVWKVILIFESKYYWRKLIFIFKYYIYEKFCQIYIYFFKNV